MNLLRYKRDAGNAIVNQFHKYHTKCTACRNLFNSNINYGFLIRMNLHQNELRDWISYMNVRTPHNNKATSIKTATTHMDS